MVDPVADATGRAESCPRSLVRVALAHGRDRRRDRGCLRGQAVLRVCRSALYRGCAEVIADYQSEKESRRDRKSLNRSRARYARLQRPHHVVRDDRRVAPCTSSFSALSAGPRTSSSRRTRSRLPFTLRRPVSHRLRHSDSSSHAHMSHIAVPFTPASRSGYLSRPHRKRSDTGDRCTSSSAPSPVRVLVDTSRTSDHPR